LKTATLIISTYKKVKELELIFTALENQTLRDFEIIVADDGSGKDFENYVNSYKANTKLDIKFITQEDMGFTKTKILNQAIKISKTDYLVFIDGDCIPNRDFMKYHRELASVNSVLCGWRVSLGKIISDKLTSEGIKEYGLENKKFLLFLDSLKGKRATKSFEESLTIRNKLLRKFISEKRVRLTGYNFSVWKSLMEKINGFDENYSGAGIGEDTDIEYRLKLLNVQFKSVRNLAVVYHLYHKKTKEENKNLRYFEDTVKKSSEYFCNNGLVKI
jgi:glycosyltransferase involved in cell wall biosynthesis